MGILDYCSKSPRPLQRDVLLEIEAKYSSYDVFVLALPTGCHAPGQRVMRSDGTFVAVEDVKVGDTLMGPDSTPRTVLALHHGNDDMYRILPKRGPSWVVNSKHVLNLARIERHATHGTRHSSWTHTNITVEDYLGKSGDYKNSSFQWATALSFPEQDNLPIDPYLFGTWLGDGTSSAPHITGMDEEILDAWQEEAVRRGLKVRLSVKPGNRAVTLHLTTGCTGNKVKNSFLEDLRNLGVLNNKHIPLQYLRSSKEQRSALFAGLMDTDGSVNRKKCTFEITQVNPHLAEDILWLCRSLGMSVTVRKRIIKGSTYYRITGSLPRTENIRIPTKLPRKALISSNADLRHTRFRVAYEGKGQYYGFTVDKDNLYLLDTFVVTHNCGKSLVATTLARWLHKEHGIGSSITVPTNLLRDQYLADNPKMHTLSRADLYTCQNWDDDTDCKRVKGKQKHYCKGCPYLAAKKRSYGVPYGIYNAHIYLANQLYKPALIADEAHTLLSLLSDRASDRIWQHDYFYPKNVSTYAELVGWLRMRESTVGLDEKLSSLLAELTSDKPRYVVEAGEDSFRGEMRNCLKLLPVDLRDMPPILWPKNKVRKIFLLSATIAQPDIVQMGLDKKRVCYVSAPSPVDAERRPIAYVPQGSLAKGTAPMVLPAIVRAIEDLAAFHPTERGLVHCTYEISRYLQTHLGDLDGRIMYHTPENRTEIVAAFKNSPIHEARILVGCGLEEGLDLPGDQGRWQVIAKIPWPSLDEPAIRWMAQEQPDLYLWQTVKKVLQASGRIVRGADDQGITYILDSTFERLYSQGTQFFPSWWREALYEDSFE